MIMQPPVTVLARDFIEAASQASKMKRAPAGAKGSIPKDTLLSPGMRSILVETPMVSSTVQADGDWSIQVSVDAAKLITYCQRITKLSGVKVASGALVVGFSGGSLILKYGTTTVTIPVVWVKSKDQI